MMYQQHERETQYIEFLRERRHTINRIERESMVHHETEEGNIHSKMKDSTSIFIEYMLSIGIILYDNCLNQIKW